MNVQAALPLDTVKEGTLVVYRIVLPFLPPSKNVYDNWLPTWKSGVKKKWIRAIDYAVKEQGVPLHLPEVGLAARLVFPGRARRDPQNYSNCLWNFVPDALVQSEVLVDDNEGRIQIGPNWGLEFAYDDRVGPKKARSRTILTIATRQARMI